MTKYVPFLETGLLEQWKGSKMSFKDGITIAVYGIIGDLLSYCPDRKS